MKEVKMDMEKIRAFGKFVIETAAERELTDLEYLTILRMLETSFIDASQLAEKEGEAVLEA